MGCHRRRSLQRTREYIVNELKLIQDAQGDGYLGALMDKDRIDERLSFNSSAKA